MEICAIGIIKLKHNLEDSNFSWMFSFLNIKNLFFRCKYCKCLTFLKFGKLDRQLELFITSNGF